MSFLSAMSGFPLQQPRVLPAPPPPGFGPPPGHVAPAPAPGPLLGGFGPSGPGAAVGGAPPPPPAPSGIMPMRPQMGEPDMGGRGMFGQMISRLRGRRNTQPVARGPYSAL